MTNTHAMTNATDAQFDSAADWLAYGIERGWCGPSVCAIHDGLPSTEQEDVAFDEGYDPCVFVVRMYADDRERADVEGNHAPSIWRKTS